MDTKWQTPQTERPKDLAGHEFSVTPRVERLGWDELSIEQKIERMRDVVKSISAEVPEQWGRLEEVRQQMRLHVHGADKVLMPLDAGTGNPGYGVAQAEMPGGKVYF